MENKTLFYQNTLPRLLNQQLSNFRHLLLVDLPLAATKRIGKAMALNAFNKIDHSPLMLAIDKFHLHDTYEQFKKDIDPKPLLSTKTKVILGILVIAWVLKA